MEKLKDTLSKIVNILGNSQVMELQTIAKTVEFFDASRSFYSGKALRLTRDVDGASVGRQGIKMTSEVLQIKRVGESYILENLRLYEGEPKPLPKTVLIMLTNSSGKFERGALKTFDPIAGEFSFGVSEDEKVVGFKPVKRSKTEVLTNRSTTSKNKI